MNRLLTGILALGLNTAQAQTPTAQATEAINAAHQLSKPKSKVNTKFAQNPAATNQACQELQGRMHHSVCQVKGHINHKIANIIKQGNTCYSQQKRNGLTNLVCTPSPPQACQVTTENTGLTIKHGTPVYKHHCQQFTSS